MTTRDQARRRIGDRADVGARPTVTPEPAPSLPERLLAARERKGVDLYRAERDTKIRARYLAALERGDWRELPGAVYTKGFLRNYALYLGLDPEDVLTQWHRERGEAGAQEPVIVVPRALEVPRPPLTFTPGVVVAALLTIAVLLFAGYLAMQLLRWSKPPTISLTDPAVAVTDVEETTTSYTLRGTSIAGATVTVTRSGGEPIRVTAAEDGTWSVDVDLRRGRNQFDVSATDPETGKPSEDTARVFITVPLPAIQAPTLTVDQPSEGATFENGAIPVQGTTTNAKEVTVSAAFAESEATPAPTASAEPDASPAASPTSPEPPESQTVPVDDDGTFSTAVELSAGGWMITVTATSPEGKSVSLSRNVTVTYKGVNLVVAIKGGKAWLKVWVDGVVDPEIGATGKVFGDGKTLTFTGKESVEVRSGSSGNTYFTLNGTSLGALGRAGSPETWLFAPPDPPVQTQRR